MPELEEFATARSTYRVTVERADRASFTADSRADEAGAAVLGVLRQFYELHPEAVGEDLRITSIPLARR